MVTAVEQAERSRVEVRPRAGLRDYVALARPSHWIKQIFVLPGVVLAGLLLGERLAEHWWAIALGLVAASLITSANYVLNEWLDAESDAHHPIKSARPAVAKRLSPVVVTLEYAALAGAGLALGSRVSVLFFWTAAMLLVAGWVYNVPPLRSKDIAYLDVLTESVNNPLRLVLGWAMIDSGTLPPASVLASYWMGGAFLMGVKRLGEYRAVAASAGQEALVRYRRSFAYYDSITLLVSSFIYALLSGFFLAVFFIKYRAEYLLALPAVALLFGSYLNVGLRENSRVQSPETLFREGRMMALVVLLIGLMLLLTWVDIPWLERLTEPHYMELHWRR